MTCMTAEERASTDVGDHAKRPNIDTEDAAQSTDQRVITILYATETGNAEEVAERLARIAYRRHIQVRLFNLADYDKVRVKTNTDGFDQRGIRRVRRFNNRQWRVSRVRSSFLALPAAVLATGRHSVRSDFYRIRTG